MSCVDDFREISKCIVGSGHTVLFWSDSWTDDRLNDKFPRLFSHAIDKLQSVNHFLSTNDWISCFHRPLTVEAYAEFCEMQTLLAGVQISNETDKWDCTLGKGTFKSNRVYNHHFKSIDIHAPSCWIWKSKCQSKHKFFAWLLLHDRINTKDMLLRRRWQVTDNHMCVLCPTCQHED